MSSFFEVDFFRVVNEGLVDDWAQVYAKVPFDKEEFLSKGALFGVLRIKGGKKIVSKGADVFLWLDEYFNKTEERGDLRGLFEGLALKNDQLQSAWIWVVVDPETGEYIAKAVAVNGGKVIIVRDGKEIELSSDEGRVVVGGLRMKDRLGLGIGGMKDRLGGLGSKEDLGEVSARLNKEFADENERAGAGLLLEVTKSHKRKKRVRKIEEPIDKNEMGSVSNMEVKKVEAEKVKKDRVVGPKGLKKKVASYWLGNFKKRRKIEVREGEDKKGKMLWLGIVFLGLFIVSVVGGVMKSGKEKLGTDWQDELVSWQRREEEAKALVQVNPAGARKLLQEIQVEVNESEERWSETEYKEEWLSYKDRLEDSWIEVSGERRVEPKLFLGLSLIRSELLGEKVMIGGESVSVWDSSLGILVDISLEDKKSEVVASDKENKWRSIGGSEDSKVFMTTDGLGVVEGDGGVEFDATVSDPVEVEVFGSGVYVLDAGAGEIWKFSLSGKSVGDRRRWLELEEEIDIGDLVDIDIDGDIWVLGSKGEVGKLRRGNRERFALEGGPDNLIGSRLAVQLEGEWVAILDVPSSRVVVYSKETGEYRDQLVWDGFLKAKDITYTDDGKLMVLSDGKLWWVE
jgi:hypothetical protein